MSHDPSAIAFVLRPPRSGKSEMRALLWVPARAPSTLLYALPSNAQQPAPASSDADAPDAAAPFQPGPPATSVAGSTWGAETASSAASTDSGEIKVTKSRKCVEAVQETPVAVSVVGARQLNGVEGAKIRNLRSNSEVNVQNFDLQSIDLQSIEVLRRPQKTDQNALGLS